MPRPLPVRSVAPDRAAEGGTEVTAKTARTTELDLFRLYLAVMGVSRERVRQVELGALAALRRPEVRARLEDLVAA